jgi:D-glycero-alpha-D-manno-heptose-7-phosphate kinase
MAAHAVETDRLGRQSGLQDQFAAAHGGISYVEIPEYPAARRHAVAVAGAVREALDRQLLLVYLGRTHSSSVIHDEVIRGLDRPGSRGPEAFDALRAAAAAARDAVAAGRLEDLGAAMKANTEAQRLLHPLLVGADAQRVIAAAAGQGALGWKINGAGGEGGSMAVLCRPDDGAREETEAAILRASDAYRVLPATVAPAGLRVVEEAAGEGEGSR